MCSNMNHFDAVDFSECHSEEVMFLLTLSLYTSWIYLPKAPIFGAVLERQCGASANTGLMVYLQVQGATAQVHFLLVVAI